MGGGSGGRGVRVRVIHGEGDEGEEEGGVEEVEEEEAEEQEECRGDVEVCLFFLRSR